MTTATLPRQVEAALAALKRRLHDLYGERMRGVYLYGSYARGAAHPDSDVDVLVVLAGDVQPGAEIRRMSRIVSDLSLEHDLLISIVPIADDWRDTDGDPFVLNVRKEAVGV